MTKLRVLYLWNPAGALVPVADWLLEHGHEARIIMNIEFDIFRNTSKSQAAHMVCSRREYYCEVIKQLLFYKPKHIHVNASLPSLVISRLLQPKTPIVFQYHGIEIRYSRRIHPEMALADKVIVSTPDLRQYGEWYDRPVDRIFHYRGGRTKNIAVMFYAEYFMKDLRDQAKKWCDERGIELKIIERGKDLGIPYLKMPQFLSKFEYFMDFKGYGDPEAISRLAIEALACGCKVVSDTNPTNIITNYEFTKPERYYELYMSMIKPKFSIKRIILALIGLIKWFLGDLTRLPDKYQ